MNQHQQKSWLRRFFASRWFLIVVLAVAIIIAFSYARAYYQDYKVREEIKNLQADVKKLEKKKLESMKILEYVTSPEFVEEKARTELNLKKPGENVLLINGLNINDDKKATEVAVDKPLLNNPMKWWYYFIHKN